MNKVVSDIYFLKDGNMAELAGCYVLPGEIALKNYINKYIKHTSLFDNVENIKCKDNKFFYTTEDGRIIYAIERDSYFKKGEIKNEKKDRKKLVTHRFISRNTAGI